MLRQLHSLEEIDFLLEQYRQRSRQRRAYAWRMSVISAFACIFVATAIAQQQHERYIEGKLAEVSAQHTQAEAQNVRLQQVQAELKQERSVAALLTYLRHPWPRTQIVSAVIAPLSDTIALTDWQISSDTVRAPASPNAETKAPATDLVGRHDRDLQKLLAENATRQFHVTLIGHAVEAASLHQYLARLESDPLIAKVELRSIENNVAEREQPRKAGAFHFTAKVYLRPAYGQSSTPSVPTPSASPLANAK